MSVFAFLGSRQLCGSSVAFVGVMMVWLIQTPAWDEQGGVERLLLVRLFFLTIAI